jgi:uncharacterized protein (DUF1501 family)
MPAPRCPGPPSRRDFLHAGALTLGGLTLADVLRGRAAAGEPNSDTAVILLYLHGGPSHLETYDLKPAAPSEYRSVFRPVATRVPGLQLCEHFPRQARIADRLAVVRSVHHTMTSHSDGGIEVTTGKTPARPDPTSTSVGAHPDFGHVASKARGTHPAGLPRYVAVLGRLYMTQPAYLGLSHAPFLVGDPSQGSYLPPGMRPSPAVDGRRREERRGLLRQFDGLRADLDARGNAEGQDRFQALAFRILTSTHTASAFDLSREPDRLRDRYGRHRWGQALLLARRLAEAGSAVVSVYVNTPRDGNDYTNWDDHILNAGRPGHFAGYMERRLPYLDEALSALVEDIYARGLDRRILVVVMGEFGRTPRLSKNASGVGRDHWPDAMSVVFSGGGLRTGQVVGATNSKGEYPAERPYTPKDVLATVYRHLGIDCRQAFVDASGRPVPVLGEGAPIAELI